MEQFTHALSKFIDKCFLFSKSDGIQVSYAVHLGNDYHLDIHVIHLI